MNDQSKLKEYKACRVALRYVNHEATTNWLEEVFGRNEKTDVSEKTYEYNISERYVNIIEKGFNAVQAKALFELVDDIAGLQCVRVAKDIIEKNKIQNKNLPLSPYIIINSHSRRLILAYETDTTFCTLDKYGNKGSLSKYVIEQNLKRNDASIVVDPLICYRFINELPSAVFDKQLSAMKPLTKVDSIMNKSWAVQ